MANLTLSDYRTVQEVRSPKVAQEFLDEFDMGDNREFVSRLVYVPGNADYSMWFNASVSAGALIFARSRKFGLSTDRSVSVNESAFDFSFSLFTNMLRRHELVHAEQCAKRPQIFGEVFYQTNWHRCSNEIWHSIIEIPAYANTLVATDLTKADRALVNGFVGPYRWGFKQGYAFSERKKLLEKVLLGSPGDELVRKEFLEGEK